VNRRLIVNSIYARYGEVKVLHGVSMHLEPSEILVLLGTNGNGKSTLIKCIMGMEKPDSGEIYLESNGQRIDLVGKSPEEIVNLGISLVRREKAVSIIDGRRESLIRMLPQRCAEDLKKQSTV